MNERSGCASERERVGERVSRTSDRFAGSTTKWHHQNTTTTPHLPVYPVTRVIVSAENCEDISTTLLLQEFPV